MDTGMMVVTTLDVNIFHNAEMDMIVFMTNGQM
jgi:hypothetical protein